MKPGSKYPKNAPEVIPTAMVPSGLKKHLINLIKVNNLHNNIWST